MFPTVIGPPSWTVPAAPVAPKMAESGVALTQLVLAVPSHQLVLAVFQVPPPSCGPALAGSESQVSDAACAAHVTVNARPVAIGPLHRDDALFAEARSVASLFLACGIPAEALASVEPLLWEKALYNCGLNPLGALHGLTYGEVVASPELRPLLDAAIDEGFAVARACGIALPWHDPADFRAYFHATLVPPTAAHRSSMRQDLEAGRRTEIDAIGGASVRAGARHAVPTPVNARLVDAIHEAERTSRPG